ncbi:hypothetical protein OJF2_29840 [Aquisphaera giovannonii]|uniref:DUF4112 domain-containing protein n=1 Tax=Aquisphaera giovannonii TaxID=406548 RepID=A0A5B9W314_9BACT|nr:DUF4112 domain-containing protein [Aquisphaera giovannonii]QEH34445.1 hypothetical protein OJF2_29840 [Aquisphaera giovannonii]
MSKLANKPASELSREPYLDPVAQLLGRLAWLMDRAVGIPGTRVRFGLDALLGLLPLGGDVMTGLVQAGLVLVALGRYRVPPAVAARMVGNVLLDTAVGAIPLLGDLFDVAFKANTRNLRLLEPYLHRHGAEGLPPGTAVPIPIGLAPIRIPWGWIIAVAVVLLGVLLLLLIGFITVVRWLFRAG